MKTDIIMCQEAKVLDAFSHGIKTVFQVSKETGIERCNIYWYKFRNEKLFYYMGSALCPISKNRAKFYTTNYRYAFSFFVERCKSAWINLSYEDSNEVWEAIKSYVLNHYDSSAIVGPQHEIPAKAWKEVAKPIIDQYVRP